MVATTIVVRCKAGSQKDHTRLPMSVTSSCPRLNVIDCPKTAKMREILKVN